MMNNTITTRTNELAEAIKEYNNTNDKVSAAVKWIKAKVLNTGLSLEINFTINPILTPTFLKELSPALHNDTSIQVEEVCESVIKIQCMNKIQRIEKLNRTQKVMLELKEFNPPLVEIAMSKLSPEEQKEISEVLLFEK